MLDGAADCQAGGPLAPQLHQDRLSGHLSFVRPGRKKRDRKKRALKWRKYTVMMYHICQLSLFFFSKSLSNRLYAKISYAGQYYRKVMATSQATVL